MLLAQMVSDYPNNRRRRTAGGPRCLVAREARATDPTRRPGRDDGRRFQVQERETITMRRVCLASLALTALLGLGQSANAQYWGGWGGWGGGATSLPEGLGIGLGVFAQGIGQMNLADAQAA